MDDQALPPREYVMESNQFDYDKDLLSSEYFGFKRYQRALYRGEIHEGKRLGLGVIVYDGKERVYEGQWEGDQRNGNGYERFKGEGVYVGEFKDNKPWGKGTYTWRNGEIYEGEWV
jgi:hypothetical protein